MHYTETSFKFPLQVGSWTLKLEQISVEEANQSSHIFASDVPRFQTKYPFLWNRRIRQQRSASPDSSVRYLPAALPHSFNFPVLCTLDAEWVGADAGGDAAPALSAGLGAAGGRPESETLLFTFSWKTILASAAFAGFSCVVGL